MRIAVTGPDGFLAWHLRCLVRSRLGGDCVLIGRSEFASTDSLAATLSDVDAVVHLAGVNRAADDTTITEVNTHLAQQLVNALDRVDRPITVVYGNSVQSLGDSVFGVAKRAAGDSLALWAERRGAVFVDVLLPNIFGEGGRPFYNSVVATFCHQLAAGDAPRIDVDRTLPLLHAQRAAEILLNACYTTVSERVEPGGTPVGVSDVLAQLQVMSAEYRVGDLPNLSDPFTRDLFNTFRSFTFPQAWPVYPEFRTDPRGSLFEAVRARGGETQSFLSTTNPGFTRGQHYHLHKVERFLVVKGTAEIRLRRLFGNEVVTFPVSGERPGFIDMPTMWVHSITNTGPDELLTLFYADDLFDANNPDTYPEEV